MITESNLELKNGVLVNLTRINDDVISRIESVTLNCLKKKKVMAMVLTKNQSIKKTEHQIGNQNY